MSPILIRYEKSESTNFYDSCEFNYLGMDDEKAASGLDWDYELESIILEIIGDDAGILEEILIDLLMKRPELSTLMASFAEFIQKIPELAKKHGKGKHDLSRLTVRDEMKILLGDLTSGLIHSFVHNGAGRKLERKTVQGSIFIKPIIDEYSLR